MRFGTLTSAAAFCIAGVLGLSGNADAQTSDQAAPPAAGAPAAPAPAAPAAPSTEIDLPYGIKVTGHVEGGTSINPDSPDNNINFGQTFTDRANTFRMNQLTFAIERDLDPKNAGYQWGFRFQPVYGTDARVAHYMNEFDRSTSSPYQFDIWELDAQAHVPTFGGGTDVKLGQYPTPLGEEVLDATGNFFYSHSYIFNYGLTFKHTGILTTTHVNDTLDVWLGLDTGNDDTIGDKGMANNFFPKVIAGVGLNGLLDGNLTVLALAHVGPENSRFVEPTTSGIPGMGITITNGANGYIRSYYDILSTYKINDSWTTVNEINVIHDDFLKATGGGVAQYLTWQFNDQWAFGLRGEVWADNHGAFVCTAQSSLDYANAQRGLAPNNSYCSGDGPSGVVNPVTGQTTADITYGEITIGANYKPSLTDLAYVTIRPELRYDTVVGGGHHASPFDVNSAGIGTKTSQFTLAVDAIIGF